MDFPISFLLGAAATAVFCLWFFYREVKVNPAFVLSLVVFYSLGTKQISVLYLDLVTVYITESGTSSGGSSATLWITLYHVMMVAGMVMTTRLLRSQRLAGDVSTARNRASSLPPEWTRFALLILCGVMFLEVVNLALSSSLALPGMAATRHTYWENFARIRILRSAFGVLAAFVPFAAAICFSSAFQRKAKVECQIAVGIIALHFFYLIATGQRFHGFLATYAPLLGVWVHHQLTRGRPLLTPRMLVVGGSVFAAVAVYGFWDLSQRGISRDEMYGDYAGLYRMLVLQGHTLWNMYQVVEMNGPSGRLGDLVDGMEVLIYEIMPGSLAEIYSYNQVNLAAGMPAMALYVFGLWWSIPFMFFIGLFLGTFFAWAYRLIEDRNPLAAFPMGFILIWNNTVYAGASFEHQYHPKFSIAVALVLAITLLSYFGRPRPASAGHAGRALPPPGGPKRHAAA